MQNSQNVPDAGLKNKGIGHSKETAIELVYFVL